MSIAVASGPDLGAVELAQELGISYPTLNNLLRASGIKASRRVGPARLFGPAEVARVRELVEARRWARRVSND
jgi:hypothetical protein